MSAVDAIQVVADFTSTGVLSRVARGLAGGLHRNGVAVHLVQGHPRGRRTDAGTIAAARRMHRPVETAVAIHLDGIGQSWPDPSRLVLQVRQAEADRVPERWLNGWQEADLLLTPSPASREALLASRVPANRLRLMPLGVDAAIWEAPSPDEQLLNLRVGAKRVRDFAVRMINAGQLEQGHFENPAGLLAAWISATTPRDDAVLLLAWDHHLGLPAARRVIERMVNDVCAALGKPITEAAAIGLVPGQPTDAAMPGALSAGTHYIAVGHGAGWDLTMMEAGAAGLRLIAPDHTGYRGWLNGAMATLLPSVPAPVDVSAYSTFHRTLYKDASWQVVDLDAAAAAIRQAIDGGDRYLPTARETILRDFTWDRSAAQLIRIAAEELEKARSAAPRAPRSRGDLGSVAGSGGRPALTLVSMLAYLPVSVLSVEERLVKVRPLLESGLSLVMYADDLYGPALEQMDLPPSVRIQRFDPWTSPSAAMIAACGEELALPRVRTADKDTIEYLTLMNLKTDIVADAVTRGYVEAPFTGFIDANIAKLMDDPAASFGRLAAADLANLDRVLMPGLIQMLPNAPLDLLDDVCWAALGSLVILPSAKAQEFALACREMLAEVLEQGRLVWEVNIWAMLMRRSPGLFHWFSSDHDDRITALPNLADPVRETVARVWKGDSLVG